MLAAAAVMAAQMVTAIPHTGAVVDEPAHLTAGWIALTQGDLSVNREHPPLIKTLAALPLLPMHPIEPPEPDLARTGEDFEFEYSRRFLYGANDADRLLHRARLPVVALSCVLVCAIALWSRSLLGGRIAALAACLWAAFEPNLLAHGRLVTTDLGAALFAVILFAAAERSQAGARSRAQPGWLLAAGAGIALGLALLSRYSGVLLVPILTVCILIDPRRPLRRRLANLILILLVAIVTVNAGYLVLTGGSGGSPFPLAADPAGGTLRTPFLAGMEAHPLLRWTPLGVPRTWIEGIDLARWKNANVEGPGFLNGEYSGRGWWSYFVIAMALKSTLPFLAALAAGLFMLLAAIARSRGGRTASGDPGASGPPVAAIWVLLPAVSILIMTTALTRAQIGYRYVLPVVPFFCIVAAVPFVGLFRAGPAGPPATPRPRRRVPPAGILMGLLIVWHAAAALGIHPYHLAYFNPLAGGPEGGRRHLVDSNLDWGQDLPGLKRFMDDSGIEGINLYYFGTADPSWYGIRRHVPPRPGYIAVSATHLMGVYLPQRDYFAPLRDRVPDATIGHSILIYHVDEVPDFLKSPPVRNGPTIDICRKPPEEQDFRPVRPRRRAADEGPPHAQDPAGRRCPGGAQHREGIPRRAQSQGLHHDVRARGPRDDRARPARSRGAGIRDARDERRGGLRADPL